MGERRGWCVREDDGCEECVWILGLIIDVVIHGVIEAIVDLNYSCVDTKLQGTRP